jgi:hypothetical protein
VNEIERPWRHLLAFAAEDSWAARIIREFRSRMSYFDTCRTCLMEVPLAREKCPTIRPVIRVQR